MTASEAEAVATLTDEIDRLLKQVQRQSVEIERLQNTVAVLQTLREYAYPGTEATA